MSRGAVWTGVVTGLAFGMLAAAVPHALAWSSEGLDVAMATVGLWAALRLASDREGPWWVMGVLALVLVSLGVAAYGVEEVPRYADLVPVPVVVALLAVGGVGSVWARRREVTVAGAALGAGALLAAAWLPLWAAVAVWGAAQAGSTSRTSLRTR